MITLEDNKTYIVTTTVAMGGTEIAFGSNSFLRGMNPTLSVLTYTGASDFISGSGSIRMRDLTITSPNGEALNIDDEGAGNSLELTNVNFVNCMRAGIIANYRQALVRGCGIFSCAQGFLLQGTWAAGWAMADCLVTGNTGTFVAIDLDPACVLGSRLRASSSVLSLGSGQIGFRVAAGNFPNQEQFQLYDNSFSGAGTYVSGLTAVSQKCYWNDNTGVSSTYASAEWYIDNGATSITFANTTDYVKVTQPTLLKKAQLFTHTSPNRLTYGSQRNREFHVSGTLTLTGTANNEILVALFKNGNIITGTANRVTLNAAGRAENVSIRTQEPITDTEYIEIWVRNITATNAIVVPYGQLTIEEI